MPLKLGRPDLDRYRDRFVVPRAATSYGVGFAGVATLLFDDGTDAFLTDGFFSRPGLARVALGRIAPETERIERGLGRLAPVGAVRAVAPVHSHYDHALDSAAVAERTGATLVGGISTAHLGRGHGLDAERIDTVASGDSRRYGAFTVTWIASAHCPPDRYPGEITAPVRPPVRAGAYRCGEAWSMLVAHTGAATGTRTALVQGSAGFVPGALAGHRAEVAYLGIGQLGVQDESYLRDYWRETVETVGARHVVLIHFDDFFRTSDAPLRALPYLGDDLDATMRVLVPLAAEQGVTVHFPTPWVREDPWALDD